MSSEAASENTPDEAAGEAVESGADKPEVQFYPPSNKLRSKVKVLAPGAGLDLSAIDRAEQALDKLSVRFEGWILDEVERLQNARDDVDTHGYNGDFADELFRAAHDLKGQGMTFGYPLVTYVAGSLCKLLEVLGATETSKAPIDLIDHHVDAIRAIVRDRIKGNTHSTASTLANSLADATDAFVDALEPMRKPEKKAAVA